MVIINFVHYQLNQTPTIAHTISRCGSFGYYPPLFTRLSNNAHVGQFLVELIRERYSNITSALCNNIHKPQNKQRIQPKGGG